MRIGLDARTIYRPIRRGTARNLIDLYTHVAALRPDWRVVAYHREPREVEQLLPAAQVQPRMIEMVGDRFDAWERFRLPTAARADRVDILHCPANGCPSWMLTPTVVTIHDLIPLDNRHGRNPQQVKRFAQSVRAACAAAVRIITPSEYTRGRLINEFGGDPSRISVNHWAPDSSMRYVPAGERRTVLERYGVDRRYVLHFGAAAIRKNTHRMIESWAMTRSTARRDWQLLIVGLDGPIYSDMEKRVRNLNLQASVRLHGFADGGDLPALLSGADVLAFPSLSEGFGLPILDAWATRTSVLTSNTTSLPEVAGDAALLVDPTDALAIANGLTRLLKDPHLRAELALRGEHRLGQFNWQATAKRFVDVMEQATDISGTGDATRRMAA